MTAGRPLTAGEIALSRATFGDAIDYRRVRIVHRKWIFFQTRRYIMAPMGAIHFHPRDTAYQDDFADAGVDVQGLFLHEMTHVWQYQQGIFLPLRRHPFCRYDYALKPGQAFKSYGLEQQAELVRHAFLLGRGRAVAGAPPLAQYRTILPFTPTA